jgi:hypothetical protein
VAFKDVQSAGSLYPTVGMNCQGAAVTFNFGGEPSRKFAYDLSAYPHVGPGFIGCLTRTTSSHHKHVPLLPKQRPFFTACLAPIEPVVDGEDDDDSEEGDLRREIKAMEMMLSVLANR